MKESNYYEILDVALTASFEEIRAAYKRQCKLFHPDINKSADATQQMQLINEAYQTLGNMYLRMQYDERFGFNKTTDEKDPFGYHSTQTSYFYNTESDDFNAWAKYTNPNTWYRPKYVKNDGALSGWIVLISFFLVFWLTCYIVNR